MSRQWRITCEVGEVENSPQGGEEVGTGGAGLSIVMVTSIMMVGVDHDHDHDENG